MARAKRAWVGLSFYRLLEVERQYCPPTARARKTPHGVNNSPLGRCGGMWLGELYRWVGGTKVLPNKDLAKEAEADAGFVTKLLQGTLDRKRPSDQWSICKVVLRTILLGTGWAGRLLDPEDPRQRVVMRIENLLWGNDGTAPYFAHEVLESATPQRPEEGVYEVLWLASQLHAKSSPGRFIVVSGGSAFAQANEEFRRVTETVAGVGGSVFFIYPDPKSVGETAAAKSIQEMFLKTIAEIRANRLPDYLQGLLGGGEAGGPSQVEGNKQVVKSTRKGGGKQYGEQILKQLHAVPVHPAQLLKGSDEVWIWSGQFLNPTFRYAYTESQNPQETHFFVSRDPREGPFAFAASKEEEHRFLHWLDALRSAGLLESTTADEWRAA